MEIAEAGRATPLGNADLLRRAMGKKKKKRSTRSSSRFSEGMKAKGLHCGRQSRRSGVSSSPFSDYAFNKAHTARPTGWCHYWTAYLGELSRPNTWPAVTSGRRRQTSPPSTSGNAGGWASRCSRRTSTSRGALRGGRRHPVRPVHAIRTSGTTSSRRSSGPARRRAPSPRFADFLPRCGAVVANKRTIESLIKAVPSTASPSKRMGLLRACTRSIDAPRRDQTQEAIGQDSLFGSFGDDAGAGRRPTCSA